LMIAAIAVLAGCADVVAGFARMPSTSMPVEAQRPARAELAVVALTRPSVVKVRAPASSCQKLLEGTGFVVAPHKVLTAAHVVAGSDSVTVSVDGAEFDAAVVSYHPTADIAIIDVPGLSAQPLNLASFPAATGTEALALGYPNGGSFAAVPARVREVADLTGPDIYRTTKVTRQVYIVTMAGGLLPGTSGGPLIDMDGHVLGVMFGNDTQQPDTGFGFTSVEIAPEMAAIHDTQPVATGACVS
jgi:S1-C subfamily serine protease